MMCFMNIYYQLFTRKGQIAAVNDTKFEMTYFKLPNGSDSERILRYFKFGIFYNSGCTYLAVTKAAADVLTNIGKAGNLSRKKYDLLSYIPFR